MSVVDDANTVSIITVCQLIGMDEVEDTGGRATKYYCPWAEIYHSDPTQKSFRVYPDTNTAHDFGGCGSFTSASLYAKGMDFVKDDGKLRLRDASVALLEAVGAHVEVGGGWDALINPKPLRVDTRALGQALDVYFEWKTEGIDLYSDRGRMVTSIFDQLKAVLPQVKDSEMAEEWLSASKQAIANMLGVEP